jgi:hypothetical protein
MSAPYNPGPGENPPGPQQWGNYPTGGNYPQQGQPGYPEQAGYPPTGQPQQQQQQGGYPQSGYQQGNYPQAPGGGYGYQQQPSWGSSYGAESRASVGVVGLVVAAVGALLLILGGAALNWYSAGGQHAKLGDLQKDAKAADIGLMKAYGSYLFWLLLIIVVAASVVASLPVGSSAPVFRIVAPVVGVLGLVLTLLALNSYWSKAEDAGATDVGIFKHGAIGLYLTLLGFLVAGVAGVFGPRRA